MNKNIVGDPRIFAIEYSFKHLLIKLYKFQAFQRNQITPPPPTRPRIQGGRKNLLTKTTYNIKYI